MKIKDSITRRKLLESTSTALLLLPLFRVFRETEALAQGAGNARAIFVYFGAGSYRDSFFPKGSASGIDSFPIVTAPLAEHKADLVFFQGLSTRGASNHYGGPKQVFAGWTQGYEGQTQSPYSIDQLLADRIGQQTLKRLVSLGVFSSFDGHQPVSFTASGQGQPAQDDPKAAFSDIFGSFAPAHVGSTGFRLANEQVLSGKKRILDFVSNDMKRIKGVLGPIEGQIFEAHVTALDDLQKEIAKQEEINKPKPGGGGGGGGGEGGKPGVGSTCSPKALEAKLPNSGGGGNNTYPKWYHKTEITAEINRFNRELMVQALACGVTKVGMLQYGFSDCPKEFAFEGTPTSGIGYHSHSHANAKGYHDIQAAIMKEVASMITELKSVKIGDKTLFDETLIMTSSDMGDNPNNHDGVSIPCFLAGRLGGKLKGNRVISYPYEPSAVNSGQHFNHLLVTVAQLMGLSDIDHIGNTAIKGPLKEV